MGRIVIAAVTLVLLAGCGSPSANHDTTTTTDASSSVSAAPQPPAPTPQYSVVGQTSWRRDGQPRYHVVIDPVDLTTDGFKQNVKLMTAASAQTKGDNDFTVRIFDDEGIATESYRTDPGGSDPSAGTKEFLALKRQHLVAIYGGGLPAALCPYELGWYPTAFTSTPNVDMYVGNEEWKPQI